MRLWLSGNIESDPGPVNPTESNRNRKQNKPFPSFCQECNKMVKTNSKRLLCIHCNNLVHLKCIGTNSTKRMKSFDPQRWICCRCYLKELPFFNAQSLSEETISITQTILISHVWTHCPLALHLMNSKKCFTNNMLLILLCCQKLGYKAIQTYCSTHKYQDIVSIIKTGMNDEEAVSECT